jgi:hypothetical protein
MERMTTPTFRELLTSQEARDRAEKIHLVPGNGDTWLCQQGYLHREGDSSQRTTKRAIAVWQGYIQESAPPPKPKTHYATAYFNVYEDDGNFSRGHPSRQLADESQTDDRIACVRVEITATEGQYDD